MNSISDKIFSFFELKVPSFVLFLCLILFLVFSYLSNNVINIASLRGQIGLLFIILGAIGRMSAISINSYSNNIKIFGLYAICRQPLLLMDIIIHIGLNIIANNILYTISSSILFISVELNYFIEYDKILRSSSKVIYDIYSKYVYFLMPIPKNIKDIFRENMNLSIGYKKNKIIVVQLYLFLILTSYFYAMKN